MCVCVCVYIQCQCKFDWSQLGHSYMFIDTALTNVVNAVKRNLVTEHNIVCQLLIVLRVGGG